MTRLHDALTDIAGEAPAVDLADRAITGDRRRRRTGVALVVVAVVAVVALGAVAGTGLLPGWRDNVIAATPKDSSPSRGDGALADLPPRGVGPLSHAYKTFCHVARGVPEDCRNGEWRVVTRDGKTYHVPQALGMAGTLNSVPLAITRDGRMMAYYSREEQTFKVRDLESGKELTAPVTVAERRLRPRASLVLSDDGRHLAFTAYPAGKEPGLLIDMRAGTTTPLPSGWAPTSVADGGDPVTMVSYPPKGKAWLMPRPGGGSPVTLDETYTRFSALAPDGRSIAALGMEKVKSGGMHMDGTLAVLDATTGRTSRKVTVRGLPKDTVLLTLGAWLNRTEVTLATLPSGRIWENRQITYAVNVATGQARMLGVYTGQHPFQLVIPGAGFAG
ncbi:MULTISPECIES: hypothetical protein [Streptosporangium]|uniref:WD40 repeat domain-containing protein n=1 Tax=Streptosporangium brasiliense TaxID=47480 RepID=A0ABT9R6B4_9ACTN|nr:hypothetical protein [Streptosporangium brasiliense]MDP9864797.1 hypothetical protein [Streptosporangium brasiliense]